MHKCTHARLNLYDVTEVQYCATNLLSRGKVKGKGVGAPRGAAMCSSERNTLFLP